MAATARHLSRFLLDLSRYTVRTGMWWFPVVVVVLGVGAVVAATAKVVVPTAVYVLF